MALLICGRYACRSRVVCGPEWNTSPLVDLQLLPLSFGAPSRCCESTLPVQPSEVLPGSLSQHALYHLGTITGQVIFLIGCDHQACTFDVLSRPAAHCGLVCCNLFLFGCHPHWITGRSHHRDKHSEAANTLSHSLRGNCVCSYCVGCNRRKRPMFCADS